MIDTAEILTAWYGANLKFSFQFLALLNAVLCRCGW